MIYVLDIYKPNDISHRIKMLNIYMRRYIFCAHIIFNMLFHYFVLLHICRCGQIPQMHTIDTHACISSWKYLAKHTKIDTAFDIETWPFFLKVYLLAIGRIPEFNLRK